MSERLNRSNAERWIGGVCGGLAEYFATHPIWFRAVFFLLALARPASVLLYVALWMLLPEARAEGHPLGERIRRSVDDMRAQAEHGYRALDDVLGAKAAPDAQQVQQAVILGSAAAGLGVALLMDSLQLLGPFRLRQLEPLALILLGIILVKRTFSSAEEE